jgi:CubicO group peptidase (beta-lactamase class C family)
MRVATFLIFSFFFLSINAQTGQLNKNLEKIVDKFLEDDAFSAVSISIWKNGKKDLNLSKGVTKTKEKKKSKVVSKTLFDLASLTKPIVVGSLFYWLENRKLLDGKWKISRFFPEIKQEFTLEDLLTHNTCLPPWFNLCGLSEGKSLKMRKNRVVEHIAAISCDKEPRYSDINYILLGFIIEKITGKTLDDAFKDFLTKEFKSKNSFQFNPLKKGVKKSQIAATSRSYQTKRIRQGEVEDRNCDFLGGVAGNAGLFGTSEDIAEFYTQMLKKDWYRKQIIAQRGYDKKEGEDSNYGSLADPKCSGHLGWTGTAFLICPKNDLVITILTNRTHSSKYEPANLDQIKLFRQAIFDAIFK